MNANRTLPLILVALAVIFAIAAVLYFVGAIQLLTSSGDGRHPKHALVFAGLAVLSLVAANFARRNAERV